MRILLLIVILSGLLLFFLPPAPGQVLLVADPQFSARKHTWTWELCVRNKTSDTVRVSVPVFREALSGRISLLNPGETAFQIHHRGRNKFIRTTQVISGGTAVGVGFADVNEDWVAPAAGALTGLLELARLASERNKRKDTASDYWSGSVIIAPGEDACALGMTRWVKEEQAGKEPKGFVETLDIWRPAEPARLAPITEVVEKGTTSIPVSLKPLALRAYEPLLKTNSERQPCRPSAIVPEDENGNSVGKHSQKEGIQPCPW